MYPYVWYQIIGKDKLVQNTVECVKSNSTIDILDLSKGCFLCFPVYPCVQVAGRLHVEVVRVGGGLEDNMAGGDEPENNQDTEFQDRKLVCMVRQIKPQREVNYLMSFRPGSVSSFKLFLQLCFMLEELPNVLTLLNLKESDLVF